MMRFFRMWQTKVALVVLGIVGAAALAVATVTGQIPPRGERDPKRTESLLLTTNRDQLAICVQGIGVPAAASQDARQQVEARLPQVARHPAWARGGLTGVRTVVDTNCASEPYLLKPGVTYQDGSAAGSAPPVVTEPSRYRLFVYVLSPAELGRAIRGQRDVRYAPQEVTCEAATCTTVTTAIYLTPDEFYNPQRLDEWLVKGLGLEAPVADPSATPPPIRTTTTNPPPIQTSPTPTSTP